MDIRDLKAEELPKVNPLRYLEEIFRLQGELLKGYIGIEGLPQYPIDPNTRVNQVLLKDFNARVTEELGEAWEYLEEIHNSIMQDGEIVTALYGFNEELGDVLHFLIELFMYSGITPDDLNNHLTESLEGNHNQALDGFTSFIKYHHESSGLSNIRLVDVPESYLSGGNISAVTNGHRVIKPSDFLILFRAGTWDVVYQLNLARNCLKNKPWKQTGQLTDVDKYQFHLKEAFKEFLLLAVALNLNHHDLFEIYWKKNLCNIFRQKSKY